MMHSAFSLHRVALASSLLFSWVLIQKETAGIRGSQLIEGGTHANRHPSAFTQLGHLYVSVKGLYFFSRTVVISIYPISRDKRDQ